MLRVYRYRLHPTSAQEAFLHATLWRLRELYSAALQERRDAYQKCGVSISAYQQMAQLKDVRAEREDIAAIHVHLLQDAITPSTTRPRRRSVARPSRALWPWKTVYNRFSNWADRGVWEKVFKALQLEVDEEGSIIDGSIIRAHQDSCGRKGGSSTMRWVVLGEDSRPTFTPSRTRRETRCTSG